MDVNLVLFEHKEISSYRVQAVETAVKLLAAGFVPIDNSVNVKETFNPIKVTADWIEEALGVEDNKKQ